ncbi:hypothetical protein OG389_00440 [Streptomyces sp. NBC_00435]
MRGELHPKRSTSVQTIRNVLQRLVEKDKLERVSQQGSVFYTWPVPVSEAAPAPVDEAKAQEPAPAAV